MFYSVKGTLSHLEPQIAVVECGGVGFKCFISATTARKLPQAGSEVKLYTHLNVREDALDLFGFFDMNELNCFKLLTSVSGVGPKVCVAILSEFSAEKIAMCIAAGDSKTLTKASGVGAKLAQRIVLELKDKFKGAEYGDASSEIGTVGIVSASGNAIEAITALTVLGYSQSDAAEVVTKLDSELTVEQLITEALRSIARRSQK